MEVIYFFFSITFSQISQQVGLYVLKTLFQCCFVYIYIYQSAGTVSRVERRCIGQCKDDFCFFLFRRTRSLNEVSVLCIFLFSFV